MNVKKSIVSAAAVLSTLAIAGCGSATDLSSSHGASLTKQSFAASVTAATSQAQSVHMTGSFSVQGQQVTMSADESLGGTSINDAAAAMTVDIAGMGSVEVRLVAGVAYINAGKLGLPGTSTKPWMKVDLSDTSNPLGAAFAKMAAMNPARLMQAFKSISTLTEVGTETVDGIQSTHYKVTVDTAKVGDLLGMPQGAAAGSLPKSVSYDVWVDGTNRPVQVTMNNAMFTVDLHFSRWGQAVHVVAPPASQVSAFSL